MKILYIITGLRFGGAEKLLYLTCKWMIKRHGASIHVIYFDPFAPILVPLEQLGVKCQQVERSLLGFLHLCKEIKRRPYDIVHTHLIHADILGRMAVLFSGNIRAKVFTTVHGTEWFRRENSFFPVIVRFVDKLLSLPSRHNVVAISQSVRKLLLERERINSQKITLLYNAIEMPENTAACSVGHCSVVYVGRLSEEKNVPCLIRAFHELNSSDISLSIVGTGPLENDLKKLTNNLNLSNQIKFRGTQFDLSDIYESHDILVLPSNYEGLGIVILEAFSYKLSVIGSNVEGIRELLDNNRGILFEKGNSSELAEKIKMLCKQKQRRNEFAQKGYEYVDKYHNIKNYVDRLSSLYKGEKLI
jgi:glycosyltransferase involved in cell wall biosynthesis